MNGWYFLTRFIFSENVKFIPFVDLDILGTLLESFAPTLYSSYTLFLNRQLGLGPSPHGRLYFQDL